MALLDKRGETVGLEFAGGEYKRPEPFCRGSQRKPQAVSGIVEMGGRRGPNIVHKGTFGCPGNRKVPDLVIAVS